MPRPQFTLRALLVAMLVVGAFLGGVELGAKRGAEREQQRLASQRARVEAAEKQMARDLKKIQQFAERQRRVEADWLERHLDEAP
ncbi:MAG TPA: hypothetical protein VG826_00500 [Pirellulales bacterium]|nr:hypothetical protein [Pirellulales bacterium]